LGVSVDTQGALAGLRVLDFSRVLAGPFCTMLLGDMGAEVIKIENPDGGDETRDWGPPWLGDEDHAESAYFLGINRNKRSVTLNLKTEAGQHLARQLALKSQVIVENFKPGYMANFGLSYEDLRPPNPGLVYCSITGFGQTGPYRDRPGYDYTIQAMSGLMSITGIGKKRPVKVGVAVSDVFAGLYALSSILAAVRHKERSGEGQYIDIALLDSQIAALVNVVSNYLVSGRPPVRHGNQHPNLVPYGTFTAADQEFVVAVGNDRQFALLCQVIDRLDLRDNPKFATNEARVHHRDELVDLLQAAFAGRPAAEWIDDLLELGIPAGPINTIPQMLHDPHVQARHLINEVTLANGEGLPLVGPPMQFSATPATVRLPPPALGEHTDEVLTELLELDAATITAYRETGVI
jgi:crotonobetainyl-CoA:carnitine CoA-transferase CaiB-like acyl-CoA transferase